MTELVEVFDAFEDTVQVDGVSVYGFVPGTPDLPCVYLTAAPGEFLLYRTTFGNAMSELELQVHVVVPVAGYTTDTQRALYELLSPSGNRSVPAAIEVDRTWGGVIEECFVRAASKPTEVAIGDSTTGVESVLTLTAYFRRA